MKKNLGTFDSMIRLLAEIILVVLYFTNSVHDTLGLIFLIMGVLLALTSFAGFSPLYALFKYSTRKDENV